MSEVKQIWASCYSCRDYADHRREQLAVPLADKARSEGREVTAVVDEFMLAVHERHMAGEPLREGGPTRMTNPVAGRILATYALLGSMVDRPTPPAQPALTTAVAEDVAADGVGGEGA